MNNSDLDDELYKTMLSHIWVHNRSYPHLYNQIYSQDEAKEGIEYKEYISDLRHKVSTLNSSIENNNIEKAIVENIYLPPKNSLIKVTWEILHLIDHHAKLISLIKKWDISNPHGSKLH